MSSAPNKRFARLEAKVELYIGEGKFYEAEQIYSTICSRLSSDKLFSEASDVAYQGAQRLLTTGTGNAGAKLSMSFINILTIGKVPMTAEIIDKIVDVFRSFPGANCVSKVGFMKAAIKWSYQFDTSGGDPTLHRELALHFRSVGAFGDANLHLLRAKDCDLHYELLSEWSHHVYKSEQDLLIARTVIQYLCLEDVSGALRILDLARAGDITPLLKTPLMSFTKFLVESVRRNSTGLFQMLRSKYALSLKRDSAFETYMDQIGEKIFNIQSGNRGGLFSDLFSNLIDSPA